MPAISRRKRGLTPESAPALILPPPNPDTFSSHEAELSVLSALLQDEKGQPTAEIRLALPDPQMFFFDETRRLYTSMLSLFDQGVTVDHITLPEEVLTLYDIDVGETREILASLIDASSSAAAGVFHANIVRNLADRRASYAIAREMLEQVAHRKTDFREAVTRGLSRLTERILPQPMAGKLQAGLMLALEHCDAIWTRGVEVTGLPDGIAKLDALTHGFQPKHLLVVAGRPGMGKTQKLLHLVRQACTVGDGRPWPCLVDSLEMSREELLTRLMQSESGVCVWNGLHDQPGEINTMKLYADAAARIERWPLQIIEDGYTVDELRLRVDLWRREHPDGPGMVGVDYLSHMRLDYSNGGDRRDAMIGEQITRPLKKLARDYNVLVVLLAQIGRSGVREPTGKAKSGPIPRPTLNNLKDSGDIEQDADQVLFLHPLGSNGEHAHDGHMELGLAKNRHGRCGWVDAKFLGDIGRYSEWASGWRAQI